MGELTFLALPMSLSKALVIFLAYFSIPLPFFPPFNASPNLLRLVFNELT